MHLAPALVLACLAIISQVLGQESNTNKTTIHKQGKVFSIFNIVHFKNEGCQSSQANTGGGTTSKFRNGTCYTASECGGKGGTAAGGCAAGFGVCCVFSKATSGSVITQNCSYIQNPGFPSAITTAPTGAITYTINRQCPSVCKLRLDFESFQLGGLTTASPFVCQDTFRVTLSNNGPLVPTICGPNTGQHIYLDVGSANSNTATLTFTLSAAASQAWDIKVTQVPCGSPSAPPADCLQFYEGLTGIFSTFNFNSAATTAATSNYLPNQHYTACIRQEEGFCCIEYLPCSPTSFTLPTSTTVTATPAGAQHDNTNCVSAPATGTGATPPVAYLGIPGSSGSCVPGTNSGLTSIYCGTALSTASGGTTGVTLSMAICDCTPPFRLDFFSTTVTVIATSAAQGVCVTWTQIPCN